MPPSQPPGKYALQRSVAVFGVDASIIDIEVDFSGVVFDKELLSTVGLPDAADW